jgi:uncharacterized protein
MTDLVGSGWAYPPRTNDRGGIAMVAGNDELDDALRMILATAPGERVMRPDFGCGIWNLLFAPLNAQTLGLIEGAVREAVTRWEPRVTLEDVSAVPAEKPGRVDIRISYRVASSNDRRNLVYPFYVIPVGEDRR